MAASSRRLIYPAMGIYAFGTYGALVYFRSQQPVVDEQPPRTWDEIADGYDGELGWDETLMGLKLCRWWLVRQAKGDVLEVSAGTGRNLPYYSHKQLSSLTLTDSSKYMLWHAAEKHRDRQAAKAGSLPVRFFLSDAQQLACQQQPGAASAAQHITSQADGPAQQEQQRGDDGEAAATSEAQQPVSTIFETRTQAFPERSFDSVVDTFGLCSHGDPVAVLKEMARVCKPDGRILLLEHGRASADWLNGILDKGEQRHLKKWGCQWNRNIEDLVAQAGLEVESISRWHFGTTYMITARPGRAAAAGA